MIGVANGEERNAFTAAWVMQVSFDPLLLALSINPQHSSYRLLKEGGTFSVNVLKHGQLDLAARFGDPARDDALSDGDWTMGRIGLPVLETAWPISNAGSCTNAQRAITRWRSERSSTASCWIRVLSLSPIATPATWMVPPRCSPTRSGNHERLGAPQARRKATAS